VTALRGQPKKAVEALRAFRKEGLLNLAAIPPDGGSIEFASFHGAAQVPALLKWVEDRDGVKNLYWTPNPTRAPVSRKPTKGDIGWAELAYVDCDPLPGETSVDGKRRHRKALENFPTPPTAVIDTGNGLCALWRFDRPVNFAPEDTNAIAGYEAINIGLRDALGGKDAGVDACQSVEHLMRVPHTVNLPSAAKRKQGRVPVVAGDILYIPERVYSVDELPKASVPSVGSAMVAPIGAPEAVKVDELPVSDTIKALIYDGTEGDRSNAVYRVVRAMHRVGVSPEQMLSVLTDAEFGISERFLEREDSEGAARQDISRILAKAKTEVAADFADDPETDHFPDAADTAKPDKAKQEKPEAPYFLTFADLEKEAPLQYLLDPIIPENSLFELYGKMKSGKTFWAISLSLCVACGIDFYGHKVKAGKVLYIIGEGNRKSFSYRVAAWIKRTAQLTGISELELRKRIEVNWKVRPLPVHINDPKQLGEFLKYAAMEGRGELVVVDTLMRNFAGNTSEQKDMMDFVRGCDALREKTGAAVLILHHPGHGAASRGAGSIALPGAVDGIASFRNDGRRRVFKVDMLRDGDSDQPPMVFQLETVTVDFNFDEADKEIESGYLALVKPPELGPEDKLLIRIRDEKPKSQTKLREGHKIDKSTMSRHVAKLVKNGYLEPGTLTITEVGKKYLDDIDPQFDDEEADGV
jgi:hypothetical protein